MIDAHIHFNFKTDDPVEDILNVYRQNNLKGIVLILNTPREIELFMKNIERFRDINYHVAIIVDADNADISLNNAKLLEEAGIRFSLKVHSRISHITEKDFVRFGDLIERIKTDVVIVDGFYYGADLEYLCFSELIIYLARRFPERKMVLAHFGGIKVLECMFNTRCLGNVYYDISLSVKYLEGTSVWKDILHCCRFCKDRVMYGSDYPDFSEEESIQAFQRLFADENINFKKAICDANACKIYFGEEL